MTNPLPSTLPLAMCVAGALAAPAFAQPTPGSVSFIARLTDDEGVPLTGPVELAASIHDDNVGGELIWSEAAVEVDADENGVLTHQIGRQPDAEPLDANVFSGRELFLELAVDGEVLRPRVPVVSVPYAMRAAEAVHAADAATLEGLAPAAFARAEHGHDDSYLQRGAAASCGSDQHVAGIDASGEQLALMCAPSGYAAGSGLTLTDRTFAVGRGAIGSSHIQDGAVTSADIANGTINAADISDGAVTSRVIRDGAVGRADLANSSVGSEKIVDLTIRENDIGGEAIERRHLRGQGVAIYMQHAGCQTAGSLANTVLTSIPVCDTVQCLPSTNYYSCNSGDFQPSCNRTSRQQCNNTLLGYIVPPGQ